MNIFETYLAYLENHPDLINSIILWTITMFFVYFILIKYRKKMIEGSAGGNHFWESAEQWGYVWLYVAAPITCFSAYFKTELPVWVWWFNIGVAGYTIGGRWIFEWVLAIRSGKSSVESTSTETTTKQTSKETSAKTETTTES